MQDNISVQGEYVVKDGALDFDGRQVWVNPDQNMVQFIRLQESVPQGNFIYVHANGMIESGNQVKG